MIYKKTEEKLYAVYLASHRVPRTAHRMTEDPCLPFDAANQALLISLIGT